jgi:3-deoxy-7-phosphoheptulonate synthase
LDLSAVPAIQELTHLPIVIDPTHSTGRLSLIGPMSLASVAAGADGLLIEVHHDPSTALCDADQALTPEGFQTLMGQLRPLQSFMRTMAEGMDEASEGSETVTVSTTMRRSHETE